MRKTYETETSAQFMSKHAFAQFRTSFVVATTNFVGGTTKPVFGFIGPKNTVLQREQKFFERNCISSV